MKFDEKTHKVIIESMTEEEAQAYLRFLEMERFRHSSDIGIALMMAERNEAEALFWYSAVRRHLQDMEDIDKLLDRVRGICYCE